METSQFNFPELINAILEAKIAVTGARSSADYELAILKLETAWLDFYQELFKFGETFSAKNASLNEALEK